MNLDILDDTNNHHEESSVNTVERNQLALERQIAKAERMETLRRVCQRLRDNCLYHVDLARLVACESDFDIAGEALQHNISLRSIVLPVIRCSDDASVLFSSFLRRNNRLQKIEFHATNEFPDVTTIAEFLSALPSESERRDASLSRELIFSDVHGSCTSATNKPFALQWKKELAEVDTEIRSALQVGVFTSVSCHCCSEIFTETILKCLIGNQSVKSIYLAPMQQQQYLRDASGVALQLAEFIRSSTSLEKISWRHVWRTNMNEVFAAMLDSPKLRELHLQGFYTREKDFTCLLAANIQTMIAESKSLRTLSLENFRFDKDSLCGILQQVRKTETMQDFTMNRCIDRSDFRSNTEVLCLTHLRSLSISNMDLHGSLICLLADTVSRNGSLQALKVGYVPQKYFAQFFSSFQNNSTCKSLEMGLVKWDQSTTDAFTEAFSAESRCGLRQLTLHFWEEPNQTAHQLAAIFSAAERCLLQFLSLHNLPLDELSLSDLLSEVRTRTKISRLHLRSSRFTEKTLLQILKHLRGWKRLRDLRFDWPSSLQPAVVKQVMEAFKQNHSLLDIGGCFAPEKVRLGCACFVTRNRIESIVKMGLVPSGIWPRVLSQFSRRRSLLFTTIMEISKMNAWPAIPLPKRPHPDQGALNTQTCKVVKNTPDNGNIAVTGDVIPDDNSSSSKEMDTDTPVSGDGAHDSSATDASEEIEQEISILSSNLVPDDPPLL